MEDIVALIDARDERAKKIDAENAIASRYRINIIIHTG